MAETTHTAWPVEVPPIAHVDEQRLVVPEQKREHIGWLQKALSWSKLITCCLPLFYTELYSLKYTEADKKMIATPGMPERTSIADSHYASAFAT